eukprot:8260450-Lingulodinium_polyedra.AAC.1
MPARRSQIARAGASMPGHTCSRPPATARASRQPPVGTAWLRVAWRGVAWRGMAWHGMAWQ